MGRDGSCGSSLSVYILYSMGFSSLEGGGESSVNWGGRSVMSGKKQPLGGWSVFAKWLILYF